MFKHKNLLQKNLFRLGLFFSLLISSISCLGSSIVNVKANDPRIGIDASDDGNIIDQLEIPADTLKIYFEFYLDITNGTEALVTVKWFREGELLKTYNSKLSTGYNFATLERDPSIIPAFEAGSYRAELWFLNTLILTDNFLIRD